MPAPKYVTSDAVAGLLSDGIITDTTTSLLSDIIAAVEVSVDRHTGFNFARHDTAMVTEEVTIDATTDWATIPHLLSNDDGDPDVEMAEIYMTDATWSPVSSAAFRHADLHSQMTANLAHRYTPRGTYRVTARWGWVPAEIPFDIQLAVRIQSAYRFQRVQATASRSGVVGLVGGVETGGATWHTDAWDLLRRFKSTLKFGVVTA